MFLYIMGSYEFSRNLKIVTDSFPWSLATEPKNCYPWDLKIILVLGNLGDFSD